MNNFYASVECMLDPALRKYPVAVCGSVEERHGIVLAKNYAAKAFDVKTGDAVWQAKQKCRNLVVVPPHFEEYIKYSKLARSVYSRYTDQVEPYGMRLVAYLPELHCAVDIAGATVTEKREQSVKAHICQSNRLGYYLIKRTADASQMAAEIKTLFIRNHIYLHTDSEKDVQVLRERFLEWKYRNACKLNGKY